MGTPNFGVVIRPVDNDARPIVAADLSTIGLIGVAPDADASIFPLNTPVLVNSNEVDKMTALGEAGDLADALRGINDQLGDTQFAARVVIVRVAKSVNVDTTAQMRETIANITGSSTSKTGIWAFTKAVAALGVTPRLIIAPGYTSQMANWISSVTQGVAGVEYDEGVQYPMVISGGGSDAVQAVGYAVGQADGSLGPVVLTSRGSWYASPPTIVAPAAKKHVSAAAVAAGGTGYSVGNTITLPNGVVLTVATLSATAVATVTVSTPGTIAGNATNPTNPVAQVSSNGAGTGATFNLTWTPTTVATYTAAIAAGANPVAAGLTPVLNQLLAHAIIETAGTSQTNDLAFRETLQSERLILVTGGVRVIDPVSAEIVTRPFAPRVAGIAVRRDFEKGAPFHSWANQAVQGIVGPAREISFALTDDANEAQELLNANIGVLVRGEVGNEFAIAQGGFVFIGTDNVGEDELWRFYNQKRGRDFIHLMLIRGMRFYLGRYNITVHTVEALLQAEKFMLRDLKADGHIIDYKVTFRTEGNSAEEIRMGHLSIGFAAEEPAPLKVITIESARYRPAVDAMIADLASQLDLAA